MLKDSFNDASNAAALFEDALKAGDVELCIQLLDGGCALNDDKDILRAAYLQSAIALGALDLLKALDRRGIHPKEAEGGNVFPSLFGHVSKRPDPNVEILEWLVEKKVPMDPKTPSNIVKGSGDINCLKAVMAADDFYPKSIPFLVEKALHQGHPHLLDMLIERGDTTQCMARMQEFLVLFQESGAKHSDEIWNEISSTYKKWFDALRIEITSDLNTLNLSDILNENEMGISLLECVIAQDKVATLFEVERSAPFIEAVREKTPKDKQDVVDFDRLYDRALLRARKRPKPKLK